MASPGLLIYMYIHEYGCTKPNTLTICSLQLGAVLFYNTGNLEQKSQQFLNIIVPQF
jgi:hypothetical protein